MSIGTNTIVRMLEVPHGERRDPERPRTSQEKRGRRERRPDEAAEERH
jgi:hypothetical protein